MHCLQIFLGIIDLTSATSMYFLFMHWMKNVIKELKRYIEYDSAPTKQWFSLARNLQAIRWPVMEQMCVWCFLTQQRMNWEEKIYRHQDKCPHQHLESNRKAKNNLLLTSHSISEELFQDIRQVIYQNQLAFLTHPDGNMPSSQTAHAVSNFFFAWHASKSLTLFLVCAACDIN